MANKGIGKVQSKRSKLGSQWNVKMDRRKLTLIFLLFLIPILILSLHLISNSIIRNMNIKEGVTMTTEFFGIDVPLSVMYDTVLCLIIFISIACAMLHLMRRGKVRKH